MRHLLSDTNLSRAKPLKIKGQSTLFFYTMAPLSLIYRFRFVRFGKL